MGRPRNRRIRYQRLGRLRRGRRLLKFLVDQASRLSVPLRVARDRLRLLGPLSTAELEAAADAAGAGVISSSAATVSFVASTSKITRGSGDFAADGFAIGQRVRVVGSAENDQDVTLEAVAALELTVAETLKDEASVAAGLFVIDPKGRE
mgnify:CR=1 FL=1